MLEKFDLLLIKQTSAQVYIEETQKTNRDSNYPINLVNTRTAGIEEPARNVRASTRKEMLEGGKMETA